MKASRTWLQTYFKEPLPESAKLDALLTEHVFEVDGVEEVHGDTVFDFKVLPDRAHHLLSHRGLAREIGVITGLDIHEEIPVAVEEGSAPTAGFTIKDEGFCRRLMLRQFTGVTAPTSPDWMQARLEAIGQKSINGLVDISNYVMFDIGQPSHVLDADKVKGELVIRKALPGEKMEVLGGRVIELLPTDFVIADDEGPLEVAGVKGGERAAVTATTKNIIVHAGNYDPTAVRRTSTRLNLRSDASKRFENEITPELAAMGMARLAVLIKEVSPEAVAGPVTDVYPVSRKVDSFLVSAADVSSMIGESVDNKEIMELLARMDCVVELEGDMVRVTPPSDRFDLVIPEDIADEVARIRGYNRLPGVLPPALPDTQPQDALFWYGEKVKNVLVSRGYSEVLLYSFGARGSVEIEYPLASDKAWLREDLAERMGEKLAFNRTNADLLGIDIIKLCEVGQVFPQTGERTSLALGVSLTRKRKGESAEDIIREDLHALSEALGVEVVDTTDTISGGAICEIDLTALIAKLPAPGTLADLGLTPSTNDVRYAPIVPYPFVARDVAVFVTKGVTRDEVLALIDEHAGPLRVRSWLFDEFVKQTDDVTRHSYAFRIVFQSPERTLEDKEINEIMTGLEAAMTAKGWEVR